MTKSLKLKRKSKSTTPPLASVAPASVAPASGSTPKLHTTANANAKENTTKVIKTRSVSTKRKKEHQPQSVQSSNYKSIFSDSPVYDLLHYFEKAPDQWAARYILILSSLLLRTAVGLGGHSGFGKPPMYGDFEAQRHWMEITNHLPLSQWYFFDLQYWGLDYPPLTAYHSWLLGKIGSFIDYTWFQLNRSRGKETRSLINFMRLTSIASDLALYIPAVLLLANILGKKFHLSRMDQIVVALVIINQPSLVLIDHGHFQYNSVMLGLFLFSVIDLVRGNLVLASIWFISCINFKQMGLYYSVFIFFYILSQLQNLVELIAVGATVVVTQIILVLPFIMTEHPLNSLQQILIRVFPFNRGLFEDKVANFWCTTNVIIKYREFLDSSQLSKLALAATLVSILPINVYIFYRLRKLQKRLESDKDVVNHKAQYLIYGFAYNALSFYLFSYQVHEKSILVPLCPILLLLYINPGDIAIIQWVQNVAVFSMYPLLYKDDLVLQYFVIVLLMNWLLGWKNLVYPTKLCLNNLVIGVVYLAMIVYHIVDAVVLTPARYPDLWVILNTGISFVAFGYFWLWLIYRICKV